MTMKNTKQTIITCLLSAVLFTGLYTNSQSQDRLPREYTNPEEMISFDRQTGFQDALQILDTFSQRFEERFIIDRTNRNGPINISLPAMHWKDALGYIIRVSNLVLVTEPDYYEILTLEQSRAREARPATGDPTAPIVEQKANTGTREIRINATFFEGNRRALREIGVDWSTLTQNVPANIQDFISDGGQGQLPDASFGGRFVQVNSRAAQNVSQTVFNSLINFGDVGAGIEVQALFSAFEADNLGRIIATPSIKIMDGEQGRIQDGQDFSIKQRDFAGNVIDQFFSTGTILEVRPQIIQYGDTTFIYLDMQAERSSAQPDPVSTIINKQQVNTHALLLDGESTVIAGLFRSERSEIRRGIPLLKDLPWWFFGLKYLFGYNSEDIIENELVILLQAELEKPIPERMQMALRSQRSLLEEAQNRHRTNLDFIAGATPPPVVLPEPIIKDTTITDPVIEEPPVIEEVEKEEEIDDPVIIEEPVDEVEVIIEEEEKLVYDEETGLYLTPAEIARRDLTRYAGEWRTVQMKNLNGYDNLMFYTIGGSFLVKDNADRLYARFKEQGYEAHMLYNESTGFYFVAYKGFESDEEAVYYTRMVQRDIQSEAWLSRIIRETRLDYNGADN